MHCVRYVDHNAVFSALTRNAKMPSRFRSMLSFFSTNFCATPSPNALSKPAVQAFVSNCTLGFSVQ